MLSFDTKHKLGFLLNKIAKLELEIEHQRQHLAVTPEFEPYSAFCRINRDNSKLITTHELYAFLM